jgi:predicted nuclease of predicted toxin-antitoxin system
MRIYLDDNIASPRLLDVLRRAGNEAIVPIDVGNSGVSDPRHLAYAIRQAYSLLTRDQKDFTDLHQLVQASGGRHPGILIACYDNDPTRDLTNRGIVTAISKLQASGAPLNDQIHILNHWR